MRKELYLSRIVVKNVVQHYIYKLFLKRLISSSISDKILIKCSEYKTYSKQKIQYYKEI